MEIKYSLNFKFCLYPEERKLIAITFIAIKTGGELKPSEKYKEFKWINPTEISDYFTTSTYDRVKEFLRKLESGELSFGK